jgi:hypothetical protein
MDSLSGERVSVDLVGSPACVFSKEVANLSVEVLCGLDAADVTDAGHDDQARAGDRGVKTFADVDGGANVSVAEEQQGRQVDIAENVGEVGFGRRTRHRQEASGPKLRHTRREVLDALRRGRDREHRWDHGRHKLSGRQTRHPLTESKAFLGTGVTQGTCPTGIRAGENECHRDTSMSTEQLEGDDSPKGEPDHMDSREAERLHKAG